MLRKVSEIFWAVGRLVGAFGRAEHGNVAMMFAIMAVPLLAATGLVIDYNRAVMVRGEMQDALDAAALFLSRNPNTPSMNESQIKAAALAAFQANFNDPNAINVSLTPVYSSTGPTVTMTGAATVPMTFMNVVGVKQLDIGARSVATWGHQRLRVALVLDNTGSMKDDGKMTALKTATGNLLTQLKNVATKDEDVYVSIVPFSKDVNLGKSNYKASWVDWTDWNSVNGSCSNSKYTDESSCKNKKKKWTPASHAAWNGCVADRDQNYDINNTAPSSGNSSTLYPAEQYSYCPTETMGLSNDWNALNAQVNKMQPDGNTNQAIGLQVGWQTLTGSPFTVPSFDPDYEYKTVIILLTDGLNTENRWTTSQWQIDAREQKTCDAINAAKITIYAVQVNTGGDPTSTLLQNCVGSDGQFFLLTSADQIVTTFEAIGTALSDLRLSS